MPKVTIVMPAYNEEDTIGDILPKLSAYVEDLGWEVIVVNDASDDKTANIVENYKKIKLINHPYNKGYGASLKSGVRFARNDYIVIMDADGQHNPEEIFNLIQYINEFDMIVGSRENQKSQDWIRKPGKILLNWTANYLSGIKIPDVNSGFRVIRKKCIEEFMHILPNSFSFSTTITLVLLKAGYNIKFVPININKRSGGKSNVKQLKDGLTTLLLITRCISLFNPLKVYAPVAGIILLFGIFFSTYGIFRYHSFPKTGIVAILAGILILFFGILADQIAALRRRGI
jgi:glycosyltransferase involved in cell wall biosynthesis